MIDRSESWVFVTIAFLLFMQFQGEIIVKVQIYSQWMEEVYVPVRVRQFAKAAKLMGKSFEEYAAASDVKADEADERQLVESWINKRSAAIASEGVA